MPSPLESIAPDARFITFPVTDGDSSRWPENIRPPAATARDVNWLRKMTMEERYACRWRNLIGQGIAKLLNKPDKEKYCLQAFPEGYWMFDHNKGPISNIRHDLYLHGSKTALRFRSPAEFIPHGYWLLTDPTLNTQHCGCKYCGGGGKKTQTEISEALGLPTNRGPTAITGSTGGVARKGLRVSGRVSGALTAVSGGPWVPKDKRAPRKMDSEWKLTSLGSNLVANSTRISDLRSHRIFRLGELVWCLWSAGDSHTAKGKDVEQGPRLWPSIIIDCVLDVSVDPSLLFAADDPDSIIQRRKYVLRRLGTQSLDLNTEYECTLAEHEILPWHAHKIGPLPASFSIPRSGQTDSNLDSFSFALRTAENLVKFWAVCDRLPIKVPVSTTSQAEQWSPDITSNSEKVLSTTTTSIPGTAHIHSPSSRSTPFSLSLPYSIDTTPPQRSPVRLVPASATSATRTRIVYNDLDGRMPAPSSSTSAPVPSQRVSELRVPQPRVTTVTETRYQGFWYGPERIWTGDLVRLAPERQAFSESLKFSSEKHSDDQWKQRIIPSPGATTRGVLMRIDKIFTRLSDAGTKECAVSGPLYEIAPANWVDPVKDATRTMASSWQRSDESTGSYEPSYPWNTPGKPPPRQDKVNSGRELLLDTPPLLSPTTDSGYVLRPLLPAGFEIPLPVSFIAGRYYPEILKSPLLSPIAPRSVQTLKDFLSEDWRGVELLSLCALAPGRYNCAVCVDVTLASRTGMLEEAIRVVGTNSQGAMI